MYYPTGSRRAHHCVNGRRMLYAFCASHGVPHRKCEKLIVATDAAEQAKVESIHAQGQRNGVEGLRMIGGAEARALEPALSCTGALVSPETGILDVHAYMLALRGDLEDRGGRIAVNTPVEELSRAGGCWQVRFGGKEAGAITVDAVVNAAGLGAQAVAKRTADYPAKRVPPLVLCKGNFFSYAGRPVFTRLIYPVPVDGGLGIHVVLDLAGRMRFGPDVEWLEREDYAVDPARGDAFYARIRGYWPGLPDNALMPGYSGIRPKLSGPGLPQQDFLIEGPVQHGLPGLVHLFGIESPGLTSSLSLADEVVSYLA
jgi:L-2-hydroxyglutarate oxidase LhgO